jgi:hypothetical protein
MPKLFLLDTHIYDEVVTVTGLVELLTRLRETGQVEILQTHIERDELSNNPNVEERDAGLAVPVTPIPTSGAVWGLSKWGQATYGDGAGNGARNLNR